MVDHAVNNPGGDEKAIQGAAKAHDSFRAVPVRLGQYGDPVSGIFKYTRQNGTAKGGMVDIGIPADKNKVRSIPAPRIHILPGCRRKQHSI